MTDDLPRLLVADDPMHGVTRFATELAGELGRPVEVEPTPTTVAPASPGTHVHFTDRLHGRDPDEAASWFESLAATGPVSVTLHDLPQASDGTGYEPRARAYRRVATAARAVACNSDHERSLLGDLGVSKAPVVIPLPVARPDRVGSGRPEELDPEAAVLGFFYPGKGHAPVTRALAGLPEPRLGLVALGCASPGHEADLASFLAEAHALGVEARATGYLSDVDLVDHCRRVAVPVVAHEHVSASGSLNSWLAAGRRPLVRDSRYAREMESRRPGSIRRYTPDRLSAALSEAWADPASTWLDPDTDLRPHLRDVAADYRAWWREVVRW